MNNLNIHETKIADLFDEKVVAKTKRNFEKFFQESLNEKHSSEPIEFFAKIKNSKAKDNQFVDVPKEFILAMIEIFKAIENGEPVTIAGKKAKLTPKQAMEMLEVSSKVFADMIKNKEIKYHTTDHLDYISMEDVIKYKKKIYNRRGKLLTELAAIDW